jgi:hypothetical protein
MGQLVGLKCDILVSKFAFKCCNLYRYVTAEEYVQVTLFEPMDLTVFPADCQGLTVDMELKQDIHEAELVAFEDGTPLADVLVDRCFLKDFRLMKMPRWGCTSRIQFTHSSKPPVFNP